MSFCCNQHIKIIVMPKVDSLELALSIRCLFVDQVDDQRSHPNDEVSHHLGSFR